MEITLTVHVPRRRPEPVDVVVEWSGRSTATELCSALADHLQEPVPVLTARGHVIGPDALVGMPPLLHGACVTVASSTAPHETAGAPSGAGSGGLLDLVVVGGPDAGRSHPLLPPGLRLGREATHGLVLADEALSRSHLFVGVGPSGVSVDDCGSTNGVVVDGVRVSATTTVDTRSTVVVGSSTLRLRRAEGPGPPVSHPGDGTVHVTPAAGPAIVTDVIEIGCPPGPPERHRARVPWVAAMVPVPVAVALALLLGPQLLLFAVLGPLTLLGGALGDRWGSGRAHRRDLAEHAEAVDRARARLAQALSSERERLDRAHPDPALVLATAEQHRAGLWRGGGAATVRLGLGPAPTRVTWVDGSTRTRPVADHAPVVVDLLAMPCLGVVGSSSTTDGVLSNLVGQLCTALAPHDLTVTVVSSDPGWSWARRLPHAAEPPGHGTEQPRSTPAARAGPVRVVVIPRAGPDTTALVRQALDAGTLVLTAASSRADLPPGCDAAVVEHGAAHVLESDTGRQALVLDRVGPWWADRLSRALAPLRCAEPHSNRRMPSRLALADALGGVEVTDEWVAARWHGHRAAAGGGVPSSPTAVVGQGTSAPFVIDLVRDGPHILVGGTTGSGKSEFLRTLVTSLSLSSAPDELTFVLVDFKGGAAFGPCATLPHVVGMVTDLDDHLVARALSSLRAELRRRERLFADVGAGDLEAYQRLRGTCCEPVPRLVVVVDELRALVEELPDFVSGLVRLAALGRSLGVHLVLATQRPSGAVSAEIQANVSLRIAFRMRDRSDSVDVLEDDAAASIRSGTPGRALARGGDGVLVSFHAATTSLPRTRSTTSIRVRRSRSQHEEPVRSGVPEEAETSRMVEAVRGAHRLTGGRTPAPPWLAPLPRLVRPGPGGTALPAPHRAPVAGLVDEPELQRITPLTWAAADGCWLFVGASGSGRTTALRAVALAAATTSGPESLHVHVIDARGTLADLALLPHAGSRVRPDDARACAALVRHLRDEVDRRLEASTPRGAVVAGPASTFPAPASGEPVTLVVVDGWDQLLESQPGSAPEVLPGELLRVLRDGRSVGVVGLVSGGRSLLHPRWIGVGARTHLLGGLDPLDAALAGLRATDVPRDPPPGRAVRVHDKRELQFAAATPDDTALLAARCRPRPSTGGAWQHRPLPMTIRRCDVIRSPMEPAGPGSRTLMTDDGILIGLGGATSAPWRWWPTTHGRRLLVAGPRGSGRTNTLRVIAESLCAAGRFVAVVLPSSQAGAVPRWPRGSVVTSADAPDPLIRIRRDHPDVVLLVDDADLLGDAPAVAVIREIIGLVDRDDGLVVVATSSADVVTRFRGVDVELARSRTGILLNPVATDREVLAEAIPDGIPRLPGRGLFVSPGTTTEVQVLVAEGSVGRVAAGEHLDVGLLGDEGSQAAQQGDPDDDPADEHPVALDQAEADGQEQHVPDDGGGARPRRRPEPAAGQGTQAHGPEQDEQGRHQHPRRVAPLAQDELDDVEHGEAGEGQRLRPGEQRGEAAGAA
ncbi:MAG TPA: FtsK/SpoIIIE domain-containing protein [Ornithinibacter sp.]|nr:FtsK/SpoIIIE domain-containing protein [Ornithinibacter sp.]